MRERLRRGAGRLALGAWPGKGGLRFHPDQAPGARRPARERRDPRLLVGYGGLVVGSLVFYLAIRSFGERLAAPEATAQSVVAGARGAAEGNSVVQVLIALLVIIAASRGVGAIFRTFHQPAVIGELVAGILLGPSLLGALAPVVFVSLFPASVMPLLGILAQLGVLLFMFVVGLELNTELLREKSDATIAISHASILLPFLLGATLALGLYSRLSSREVTFTAFSLFLGISMSVTAFPVLARILTDRQLHRSRMGTVALTCAAADDITAWCLLALVVGVIQSRVHGAFFTAVLAVLYVLLMLALVRPLARRFAARYERSGAPLDGMMAPVSIALLLSSLATKYIGIHTLFGAFMLGAIVPHDSLLARTLTSKLEEFVVVMLLPVFFAFTGLRTQIGLISGNQWLICGLIILVASAGKFGGSALAARLTGMSWRDSASLGILMNTRGLMELIVLNIGLELKVISPTLFAMLVLMAVATTFATTPILDAINRGKGGWRPEGSGAEVGSPSV
jgi:Kef-type K+ transport system membrane component KefB